MIYVTPSNGQQNGSLDVIFVVYLIEFLVSEGYSVILIVSSDAYRVDWNLLLMSSGCLSNLATSLVTFLFQIFYT